MKKSQEITALSNNVMSLVDDYASAKSMYEVSLSKNTLNPASHYRDKLTEAKAKVETFADEYAVLKYCYSPHSTCKIIGDIDHEKSL